MRRALGASRYNKRANFVSFFFQVNAHCLEYQAVVPRSESRNIFSDDPSWTVKSDALKHNRPEVAVVCRSFSSSGCGEGLAGEAAGEEIRCERAKDFLVRLPFHCQFEFDPAFGVGNKLSDVAVDWRGRPVFFEDGLAEGIMLDELMLDIVPHHFRCKREPADAGE